MTATTRVQLMEDSMEDSMEHQTEEGMVQLMDLPN
jgi:hypothetical protein